MNFRWYKKSLPKKDSSSNLEQNAQLHCAGLSSWLGCDVTVSSCANSFPARVCLQAHCVKTEPGEPGENKPNLRRRMGSFVAKQEPGQYRTLQQSRCTRRAKVSSPMNIIILVFLWRLSRYFCRERNTHSS